MTGRQEDSAKPGEAASLPWLSARQMGVIVLFVSMSVLFAATIVGFWWTRVYASNFRAPGLPDLPVGLLLSTLLIALTSVGIWQAQRAIKQNPAVWTRVSRARAGAGALLAALRVRRG